ncbi:MAG TPA: STAS domain-containing protein [Ilumatobacteraceae bacterium]|nr:STAS domain-containing protein [Ilumatobacteraceae bacterium]
MSERLSVQLSTEGDQRVVSVTGELDAASRDQLVVSATAGDHRSIVIDLAGVTFMDCSGYGSLAATRVAVEGVGRTLTTRGQTGQPGRLFELIATLEDRRCSRGVATL